MFLQIFRFWHNLFLFACLLEEGLEKETEQCWKASRCEESFEVNFVLRIEIKLFEELLSYDMKQYHDGFGIYYPQLKIADKSLIIFFLFLNPS